MNKGDKLECRRGSYPIQDGDIVTIREVMSNGIVVEEQIGLHCVEDFVPAKVPESIAVKHDNGKYDPTMLSQEMLELVSRVRMFGANKYSRGNWKKGFKQTRSLGAAMRHLIAYMNGEDNDPESGLSHLGHAICSIEHCIYDAKHHPQNDDRKD